MTALYMYKCILSIVAMVNPSMNVCKLVFSCTSCFITIWPVNTLIWKAENWWSIPLIKPPKLKGTLNVSKQLQSTVWTIAHLVLNSSIVVLITCYFNCSSQQYRLQICQKTRSPQVAAVSNVSVKSAAVRWCGSSSWYLWPGGWVSVLLSYTASWPHVPPAAKSPKTAPPYCSKSYRFHTMSLHSW